MDALQLVETINEIFPKARRAQILLDIDTSQKKLASSVGNLTTRGQLSSIASNVAWVLPNNFKELEDVVFYDSDSKPKYVGDYNYAYDIEFDKFYIYSLTSTVITGLNTEINTAYIHYKKLPATVNATSVTLEIPLEYRDAIEHDVLSKYFGKFTIPSIDRGGNIIQVINSRLAQWHRLEYDRIRIQAKRDFNMKQPLGAVQNYQYAGKQVLPRRGNDASQAVTATTQVNALTDLYAKYVAFTITSPATVTETIAQIGYSTVSGVLSGNTFTLSSTAEFGNDVQPVCNNGDVTWSQSSSSTIVFTLPVGWGTIAFEIYERI